MLWSLDQDDYNGLFCGEGEFPLTRRVYDVLRSSVNSNEQEPVQSTDSSITVEPNTPDYRMLPSPDSPFHWLFFNRSSKNVWSFYLFFIVFLLI